MSARSQPTDFAVPAGQAASARAASIVSAHTASQIISIVTVLATDRSVAVAIALAVVSDALKRPALGLDVLPVTDQWAECGGFSCSCWSDCQETSVRRQDPVA